MALFDKPIALTPTTGGGLCITTESLQPADIIVSTTRAGISGAIRIGMGSKVSHAKLYIGDGKVIEAIGEGVVSQALDASLAHDALAVAYRSPNMTAGIAARIVHVANSQIGKPYSVKGAALSSDKIMCRLAGAQSASFFCSQLVLEAYNQGGLSLTTMAAQCVTPEDIVVIAQHRLTYVGHLAGNAAWFPVFSP